MTPEEIIIALQDGKWQEAGQAILKQDMFIGYPASKESNWKGDLARVLSYPDRCNNKKCGRMIPAGEKAIWIKGKGAWCIGHYSN